MATNPPYKPIFVGQEEPIVMPEQVPTPASRVASLQRMVSPAAAQSIYDSIFGPQKSELEKATEARDASFQDWINSRKAAVEQQRTADSVMAKYNAFGNLLTTMAQPVGWVAGGGKGVTAGVQPYDSRQYLEAFNRAVRANDELRNIGNLESEYQFKLADDEYKRQQTLADYEQKQKLDLEKQKEIFAMRSQLNQEQIEGRIKVAEANARAKFKFSVNGKKVTESVRDNLLKRANTAYANILADYYKKKAIGIENLQEPPSYDEFLKQFASQNGYAVADSQNAKEKPTTTPAAEQEAPKPEKKGGFQTGSAPANSNTGGGKKGGFQK